MDWSGILSKAQRWVDDNKMVPKIFNKGRAHIELDENYIAHIIYSSTEIVRADMKNKIILITTKGDWDTMTTRSNINAILWDLENMGYPRIRTVRHEYDSSETEADRDAEEAKLNEKERKWRNQRARERYKENVVRRREMKRLRELYPKEIDELQSGDYGWVHRIDEPTILNHIKRKEEQEKFREQYPEAYDALIKEPHRGYIGLEAIEEYLKKKKTREWEERWTRRSELREKDKMRMALI